MGFLSGGYLPSDLRGKSHSGVVHVADWCEYSKLSAPEPSHTRSV